MSVLSWVLCGLIVHIESKCYQKLHFGIGYPSMTSDACTYIDASDVWVYLCVTL